MFYDEPNTQKQPELVPEKRIAPALPPPIEVLWKNRRKNLGIQFFPIFSLKIDFFDHLTI